MKRSNYLPFKLTKLLSMIIKFIVLFIVLNIILTTVFILIKDQIQGNTQKELSYLYFENLE